MSSVKTYKSKKDFLLNRACRLRGQKGASLVEFAVIAPLLFLIIFGIIEFGILIYDNAMLTNASREGARTGILFRYPALDNAGIETLVNGVVSHYCQDHLISFGTDSTLNIEIEMDTRSIEIAPGVFTTDNVLMVNVQYPFRFLVFSNVLALIGGNIQDAFNLRAQTVMRRE
jgi:Flp pilus assembly protein TadG